MERLTYFKDGHWRVNFRGVQYQADFVDRLAAYEDTGREPEEVTALGKIFDYALKESKTLTEQLVLLNHIRELAEADKARRIRIIQESQNETCGHCYNFEREPGTKHGTCAKRLHPRDRYGKIDRSKQFIVSQSTQSCRLYISLRSEAERAMEDRKDG